MTNCKECGGGPLELKRLDVYRDARVGIGPVVVIHGARQLVCHQCGDAGMIVLTNPTGLLAAIAVTRAKDPTYLVGREFRFLRKALGWTARETAERLQVSQATISNWENDKTPIDSAPEKLVRLWVGLHLSSKAPLIKFNPQLIEEMVIRRVRGADMVEPMCFRAMRYHEAADEAEEWAIEDVAA